MNSKKHTRIIWSLAVGAVVVAASGQSAYCQVVECPEPFVDTDQDGICDELDNCPEVANPDQSDVDENGIGDACQDTDGDEVLDIEDNCPTVANPDQEDLDENGVGDVCEDTDGDGVIDPEDLCPDSDLEEFLVIDGCRTGVENVVGEAGCSMADQVLACELAARNHGKFVSCVAKRTKVWYRAGMIPKNKRGRIILCAARADIPPDDDGEDDARLRRPRRR